jgi:hypothetical protein
LNLTDNSRHLAPQSGPLAFNSGSASRCADVLARESASDDVHQSTPGPTVESSHVIPYWERIKAAVVLSGHKDTAGVIVFFDGADGSPPEDFAAEYSAPSARE